MTASEATKEAKRICKRGCNNGCPMVGSTSTYPKCMKELIFNLTMTNEKENEHEKNDQ